MKVSIKVNLDIEEEKIFSVYSNYTNVPLSILLKDALMQKIEDEADIRSVKTYERLIESNEIELYSLEIASELLNIKGNQ